MVFINFKCNNSMATQICRDFVICCAKSKLLFFSKCTTLYSYIYEADDFLKLFFIDNNPCWAVDLLMFSFLWY
jgi:hypothetical protein